MKDYISDKARLVDASGIRKVFALAETLKDPINFSIGQPHFDVPEKIKDEAIKSIRSGFNKYSQTTGDIILLAKIKQSVQEQTGWKNPQVIVTNGVSGGLLLAFMSVINPGDEVIIPDPYFVIYKHLTNLVGGKCIFVDTYPDFDLPVEKIAKAITKKTKLIIINSPCNPTGAVYSQSKLKALAQAAARDNTLILSDQIYDHFCYDFDYPNMASYYENTILLKGFGKSYAMTGWRLGYAAVSEALKPLIEEMTKIQQYTFVCAPTPLQKAAIAALDYDISPFIAEYKNKRDLIYEGLKDCFELIRPPQGSFYAFIKAPGGNSTNFVEKAISNNVLMVPGKVFSEKDTHFRLSYATTDEKICEGIKILCSLV